VGQNQSHNKSWGLRNSPNHILAIIIVVILIVVTFVAIFSTRRSAVTLNPATPQGTVQAYLLAALEGNNAKAAQYLAPESGCNVQDLDRAYVMHTARVALVKTEIQGTGAQVWVSVDIPSGGPFETFNTEDHTFRLVNANGRWLLTGIPWPLYNCGVVTK
jgi:hypothetical protein